MRTRTRTALLACLLACLGVPRFRNNNDNNSTVRIHSKLLPYHFAFHPRIKSPIISVLILPAPAL